MGVNGSIWMTGWDSDAATEYDADRRRAALVDGQRVWLPSFEGGVDGSIARLVAIDVETLERVAQYDPPQQQLPWSRVAAFDSLRVDSTDGTLLRIPLETLQEVP